MDAPYFRLKSQNSGATSPGFDELRQRLIRFVIGKIRDGEFTERGLARQVGVSQPQLHNVLKGARVLKPELGDLLLRHLDITLLDLLSLRELNAASQALTRPFGWWTPTGDQAAESFASGSSGVGKKPPRGEIQHHAPRKPSEGRLVSEIRRSLGR
jgi:hypothetical protein